MENIKKFIKILDRWKPQFLFSGILLILSTFIRLMEPRVLQIAVDKVIVLYVTGKENYTAPGEIIYDIFRFFTPVVSKENAYTALLILCLLFLSVSFLRAFFMFSASAINASCTEKAVKKLRDRLFAHIQALPLMFHSKISTGEVIQRCTGDVETLRVFISQHIVELVRMCALFIGAFYMMLSINSTYALIAITLVPFIGITSYIFYKKEKQVWDEHELEQDKLTRLIQENLSGVRVVKAFSKENFEIKKFNDQNIRKRTVGLKQLKLQNYFYPISDLLVNFQISLSVVAGAYFTLTHVLTVGQFTAFFTYAVLVTWPMRRIGQLVTRLGMTKVAIDRLSQILDEIEEIDEGNDDKLQPLKGEIEFRNVSFSYEGSDTDVINDISFTVKPGEKIALLGPTGAGKSTIIALLTRFYEPDSGEIFIDGRNIKEYSKHFLRKRIGVVLQKPFLFSRTIRDNIAYGSPESDLESIIESAKAAGIHDIIMEVFPEGYETVVGEKGVTLSGGQKQRITLARTVLNSPDVLILDDSTSSVDTQTEFRIQKALGSKMEGKTTLVIAHRISSVHDSDRIIIIDKGRIVEMGTHEELIGRNGFYRSIYEIQSSLSGEDGLSKGEIETSMAEKLLYNK